MEQYLFSHAVAEVLIMGHKDQPTRVPLAGMSEGTQWTSCPGVLLAHPATKVMAENSPPGIFEAKLRMPLRVPKGPAPSGPCISTDDFPTATRPFPGAGTLREQADAALHRQQRLCQPAQLVRLTADSSWVVASAPLRPKEPRWPLRSCSLAAYTPNTSHCCELWQSGMPGLDSADCNSQSIEMR